MRVTRTSGRSSWRRDSDPPVEAPFGCRVHAVSRSCDLAGDGGDVHDVAAAGLELVKEDFSGGDRAEEVDLEHPPVVVALVGRERSEQHDPGVVDQHVGAAEFLLHAVGGGDEGVAVGDVGRDRAVSDLLGQGGDPVDARASSATRYSSAARARAVAAPIPDDAPVITATRPCCCVSLIV
jgi:hypothetical protein